MSGPDKSKGSRREKWYQAKCKFKIRGEGNRIKIIGSNLPDKSCPEDMKKQTKDVMEKVENIGLPGKFKEWSILYEVPPTREEAEYMHGRQCLPREKTSLSETVKLRRFYR